MREKAEEVLTEFKNCPNGMPRFGKGLKTDNKKLKEVIECCASVRRKEVKSGRIIWKGS